LDGSAIPIDDCFQYLESIIEKDRELVSEVAHRVKTSWLKWRGATSILCDRKIPLYLKKKFYRTTGRPALLYGTKCWTVKGYHIQKMKATEMHMLQ
jgi:hypothetical protein